MISIRLLHVSAPAYHQKNLFSFLFSSFLRKTQNSNNTGRFIMFSVISNIYNKKTKGPTLMEFFTVTGKMKKFFFINRNVRCVHHNMLTCVWRELEYRIDVCRVPMCAVSPWCTHRTFLFIKKKKTFSVFLWL